MRTALFSIHSEKWDHCLQTTSSERHYCGIFVSAVRQTRNGRCQSRSGSRSFNFIDWFCCSAAVWCYTQTTAEVQPLSAWSDRYVKHLSHHHKGWGIPFIDYVKPWERGQDFASWKSSASIVTECFFAKGISSTDNDEGIHSQIVTFDDICLFTEKDFYLTDLMNQNTVKPKTIPVNTSTTCIILWICQLKPSLKLKVLLRLSQSKQASAQRSVSQQMKNCRRQRT